MARRVAVIGAGPGGLVSARWLLSQGFEPVLFEKSRALGGQWTGLFGNSGVWPTMHTNTSRILTAFSDLDHETEQVFLANADILGYLHRYASKFDLLARTRFGSRVDNVDRDGSRWSVSCEDRTETFDNVVIATGRFHAPLIPDVPGLSTFDGSAGVISSYNYRGAADYRGKRVLVAGCAISALEIAVELAQLGASEVVLTQRRQRYVLPKFAAGVPSDHRIFTRYGVLASEILEAGEIDRQLKEIVVDAGGSPQQYGAPAPDPSLFAAGVTLNQQYLPLVAEGRITVRPWMEQVLGSTVTFRDGASEEFDGMVFGTGFRLDVPCLGESVRTILDVDSSHLDADRHTFHPDLPGLAFVGMWDQSGGYFVPLELQARWIAYAWGGAIPPVGEDSARDAINAYRGRRGLPQKTRMNLAALTFARAAGVEPNLEKWPHLRRALLFGPLAPSCFRLDGPDALPGADVRFAGDAAAFGAIIGPDFTERESSYMALLSHVQAPR